MTDSPACCRKSLASSLADTAKRLLENPSPAPKEVAAARHAVCKACDYYEADKDRCSICHCYMKLKTSMANMKCPVDKWLEYKDAD